jgi:hypothetical protein
MNAMETTKVSNEYSNVTMVQLAESATNPRKTFDEASLEELAQSIRSHGVLSPLVVRRGKAAAHVAQRLKLLGLAAAVADAFAEERLGSYTRN